MAIREIGHHLGSLIDAALGHRLSNTRPAAQASPSTGPWLTSAAGAELPKGWLTPAEDALVPPRQLWIGPRDPISHYDRWAWEYLASLTLLCDLRRESAVLELGCGHGRTARGLRGYLSAPGRYAGLDVDRVRIEEAQARIQRRQPAFQCSWADVHHAHYHPSGRTPAASYRCPVPDEAFEVIYAASLFTHLLPDETRTYFHDSRRVLKPGGKCLFSLFLLDH